MTSQTTASAPAPPADTRLDRHVVALAGIVVLGAAMTVLDLTIVNVAVPTLGRDLHASISTIQWVLTAYMLAFATVIPLSGWASERYGAKNVWIASLLVFTTASALAGAAWSIGALVAFRVLQGLGAGMIMPVGQTMLAQAAGPQRMGRVMAVMGVPMLIVPVLGPVAGGAIIQAASWRWIFYLNLPVGLAALAAARRLPQARPQLGQRLDVRGLLLLSPGIGLLLYGLSRAGNTGSTRSAEAIGPVVAGLLLIGLFVWHAARRGASSLIDIGLFRRRGFATAAAANFLLPIALFGTLILLPLYYQVVREQDPLHVGLLLAPQGLGAAIAMPLAGWLTDRIGARAVVAVGVLVGAAGTLAYTQVGAHTAVLYLSAALLVVGIGIGATIMPSMTAAFQALRGPETPRATSALNAIQRIAGAIGTALMAVVLQREITARTPALHGGMQALAKISPARHAQLAPGLAAGFGATFWVAVALIAAAIVPALLLPGRPISNGRAAASGDGD
jgi:EmrB/QacA subfamily drug resistance transporter